MGNTYVFKVIIVWSKKQEPFQCLDREVKLHPIQVQQKDSFFNLRLNCIQLDNHFVVFLLVSSFFLFLVECDKVSNFIVKYFAEAVDSIVESLNVPFVHFRYPIPHLLQMVEVVLGFQVQICLEQVLPKYFLGFLLETIHFEHSLDI